MKGALASLGTINRLGGASVEQISRIGPMAIHQLKRLKIGSMGREKKIKSKRTESLSQLRPKVSRVRAEILQFLQDLRVLPFS